MNTPIVLSEAITASLEEWEALNRRITNLKAQMDALADRRYAVEQVLGDRLLPPQLSGVQVLLPVNEAFLVLRREKSATPTSVSWLNGVPPKNLRLQDRE